MLDENARKLSMAGQCNQSLRVISIAHPAFAEGSGRLRYRGFANDPTINLTVIIPARWSEFGREVPRAKENCTFRVEAHKICFPKLPKVGWYMHWYPGMSRFLHRLRPDVIHLWEEPWSAVAAQAAVMRQLSFPAAALVLETDQNVLRKLPRPFEMIRRRVLGQTDFLVARQQEALDVSRACGYDGPSGFVGYMLDRTCFGVHDRVTARRDFHLEGFTVGYVGRLTPEKGLFTVLTALSQCSQPINFVMIGSGPSIGQLAREITRLRLQSRVRILQPESQDRIAVFMTAIDVLVLFSETTSTWKEQFGRVVIEAQACGTPVIGSTSGSIPFVAGNGGWIVPEKDHNHLAALLDRLCLRPREIEVMSTKAKANVERFSDNAVTGSLRHAWLTAASARRQPMACRG